MYNLLEARFYFEELEKYDMIVWIHEHPRIATMVLHPKNAADPGPKIDYSRMLIEFDDEIL